MRDMNEILVRMKFGVVFQSFPMGTTWEGIQYRLF